MLERYLIEHCSPTLASLKTASLFTVQYEIHSNLLSQLREWNLLLGKKGVSLRLVRFTGKTALIYVYRWHRLERDLQKPGVAEFLAHYGYESLDPDYAVERLSAQLMAGGEFPHEIGLFLGYPLGDVIGFIENAGQNSKCSGCWKVYCNECEAIKAFARFRKCRNIYNRLWNSGRRTVEQLTVAA